VSYVRHEVNRGHIDTYNEGLLGWARSDYCLLLSADDLLTPGALGRAARLMDDNPDVVFTYGRAVTSTAPKFEEGNGPTEYRHRVLSGAEFWELSCRGANNLVPTPTLVCRTRVQQAIGGYRKDLPHTGDLEMVLRFAVHGSVGVLDTDQAFYRVHGNNMHVGSFPSAFTVLQQHQRAFDLLFDQYQEKIPECPRMRDMAMRGTAVNALSKATRLFEQGDVEGCDKLMEAAAGIYSSIRQQREWKRLRIKRAAGVRVWSGARFVLDFLRKPAKLDRSPFGKSGLFPGL
jgi:hypothetical protein